MAEPTPLADDLSRVQQLLDNSLEQLQSPLHELVAGQIAAARPPLRAAVVLAAASTEATQSSVDERPLYLAAALEMLFVALNTHKRLLTIETPDRTLLGGTILVGDYCFGQAAELAVRTENPKVVTLFSDALKTVSEGNLRQNLHAAGQSTAGANSDSVEFDENGTLFQAGIQSASILAGHSPAAERALLDLGHALAAKIHQHTPSGDLPELADAPPSQQARWRAVIELVNESR